MDLIEPHFRSVNECPQEVECQILGVLPEWLQGSLIRLGPGKWDLESGFTLNHWLDGCAILIKFRFDEGRVFYSTKFLRSSAYNKMVAHGKPVFTEFGTRAFPDPSKPFVTRLISQLIPSDLTDNDISNIYLMNKRLFVATESCNIWRVDPSNISGIEKYNLDKEASVNLSTSHPLYSASDDCYYNVGTNFLSGMKYSIYRVPKREDTKPTSNPFKGVKKLAVIPSRWKTGFSYIHSFAMTENFVVLIEQPLVVNGFKLATCTLKCKSMEECLEWRPDEPVRFYLVNKTTGREQDFDFEYETEAFFFFHVINAFESEGYLIIDLVAYEDIKVLEKYHIKYLRNNEFNGECQPVARRYVLPLESRIPQSNNKSLEENLIDLPNSSASAYLVDGIIKLTHEQLAEPGFELPTINHSKACKKYRFTYGSGTFDQGTFSNSAIKLDLDLREVRMWKASETAFPGEAFFVSKPDSQDEDDGIILSAVLESDSSKKSFLVILDARNMMEMGRIMIPRDIPPTIHGVFISNLKEII